MDYLEIVLKGYFNENNRKFLEKYFFREFKKAEKEQLFEADEFFNGCLKVIKGWEKHLQYKVFERQRELYLILNIANEQRRHESIEYCKQELKDVRPDGIGSISFTVDLHSLTNGRISYDMAYNEVLYIKHSILKAFKKTQPDIETLPPQPINNETELKKYTAKHYVLAYIFECYSKGEICPIGNKKELERIGNERIGAGKGNRFYKVFNEVINKDLNVENNLIEIGGENWRKAVIELSKAPELVEKYLQSKQL
jgi:hypothetical protein